LTTNTSNLKAAHEASFANEKQIKNSQTCGCFFCLNKYPSKQVVDWVNEEQKARTGICPECGIDSVLGDASGYPVSEEAFLQQMQEFFFGQVDFPTE